MPSNYSQHHRHWRTEYWPRRRPGIKPHGLRRSVETNRCDSNDSSHSSQGSSRDSCNTPPLRRRVDEDEDGERLIRYLTTHWTPQWTSTWVPSVNATQKYTLRDIRRVEDSVIAHVVCNHRFVRADYMDPCLNTFTTDLALALRSRFDRNMYFDVQDGKLTISCGDVPAVRRQSNERRRRREVINKDALLGECGFDAGTRRV